MLERFAVGAAVCLLVLSVPLGGAAQGEPVDVFSQETARFRAMLLSPLPQQRLEATQGLAYLKEPSCESALADLLKDQSTAVRREVAIALGQCGTAQSIPGLTTLLGDSAWTVRVQAHDALCRMTAQAFAVDDQAAWETWWQGSNLAAKEKGLLDGLASKHVDARLGSLRALRFLSSQSAEDALLTFARKGRTAAEHRLAILALERIGTPKAIPYLAGQWRRPEAAWALGRIGGPDAEEALLATMARDIPSWQWQTIGDPLIINLDRLESTAGDRVLPKLIRGYGLITDNIRYEDLTLPPTPTQRAITNLIRRSGKADLVIELVLRELEGKGVEADIPDNLKATINGLRMELKPGFYMKTHSATAQALSALYHLADDRALVPRLMPLLKHKNFVARIYVAMTVAKLKADEALPPILAIIREGYPFGDHNYNTSGNFWSTQTQRWRGFLALAVGRLGGEAARLALEELAMDPKSYRDVRHGAVVGLGYIGSPASIPVLERVAKDDITWLIREVARETIEDIQLSELASIGRGGK